MDRSSTHQQGEQTQTTVTESSFTDSPPACDSAAFPLPKFSNAAQVTDDGRIHLDFDSNLSQALTRLATVSPETASENPPLTSTTQSSWSLKLNIVIQVVGSRGDIQPFIAMGNELQARGHRVRIATHNVFDDFVQRSNLEFFPIGGDPAELMAFMVKHPGLIPNLKSLREGDLRAKRRMIFEILQGCWKSCFEPDPETGTPFVANAIIANPPSFAHLHCAQALSIPFHMVFTMPWSPTRAFPHPLADITNSSADEKLTNYLSYCLVQCLTWQGLGDLINYWRKSIGLMEIPVTEGPFLAESLNIPYTYCWSPALAPRPSDWADHIDVTGFIFRQPPPYTPTAELDTFLRAGSIPIYVGFGSIVVDNPNELLDTILQAAKAVGTRAIISKGWSQLESRTVSEDVLFVGDCPHEWLFQHVQAVVHHGGAGTTAAGLAAGKPTVIVPFFGDQPFWGERVASIGAGPAPIPHRKLTSENLAQAIRFCFEPQAIDAAKRVSEQMQSENGVKAAVDSFHRQLDVDALRCDLIPTLPAVFECTKQRTIFKGKKIKISGLAADILQEYDRIGPGGLTTYRPKPITIENRRWDPFTSAASTTIGIAFDLISTTNDIWYAPHKMRTRPTSSSSISSLKAKTDLEEEGSVADRTLQVKKTARYIGSSAINLPKLFGVFAKGLAIDAPFAIAEGFRAAPRLFGEEVKDHEPITDWKSGIKVGCKEFVRGVGTGVVDILVQPYKGARDTGPLGFAAGVGRGAIGTFTKAGSGMFGLVGYPAQGIYRSAYAVTHGSAKRHVARAKRDHDRYVARAEAGKHDEQLVVRQYDAL